MRTIEPPPQGRAGPARLACALALMCATGQSLSMQVIDASDGASAEAILSIQEPTRIRIEGSPITDVFGNIYSSGCALPPASAAPALPTPGSLAGGAAPQAGSVNPAGEIVLECDRDKGEIYVRPVGESKKPVNLFVSSASATYTLVLRRADTPSDTIVIRDKEALRRRAQAQSTQLAQSASGAAASHVRQLKALLVAMATGQAPADIQSEAVGQPVALWREARFTLERTYRGRGLIGERYLLQNVSDAPMTLAEQEFDRADDESASVAGIAIEYHNLLPGERTPVYVIRREAQP
ncbi:MAG: type-F conjugative transfer system secretin TraK [Desulfovibrionaceae bacterium]|nr:type-F conjugative transfer system secretin TraK [Desulfovibrionaceae bacterium]